MGHVSSLTSNPQGAAGILDSLKGAMNTAGGKEQVMGWVQKLGDMAHSPDAANALHGVADKLKAQGVDVAHLGDSIKNAVGGDKNEMMAKLQGFAAQHGIDASSLQNAVGSATGAVQNAAGTAVQGAGNIAGQAANAAGSAGTSLINWTNLKVTGAANAATGAATGAASAVGNAAAGVAAAIPKV
jgi:hypothetical protein